MIANIENRLKTATSMQNLLDKINDIFSWHGKVASIRMAVDWNAPIPKVICCVEMGGYEQVCIAKIVWGVTPVGHKSFIFSMALDPGLLTPEFSDVILWDGREAFRAENAINSAEFLSRTSRNKTIGIDKQDLQDGKANPVNPTHPCQKRCCPEVSASA